MAQSAAQLPAEDEHPTADDSHDAAFFRRRCCCLFDFPCFNPRQSDDGERVSTISLKHSEQVSNNRSWWNKGIDALKKVREWSELVAGPKWKTLIRRFNKTGGRTKPRKFQYDPLGYSLNFDEGGGQNGEFDSELAFREYSSRYSAIPVQNVPV